MLRLRNLRTGYGTLEAVKGVTLHVESGEVVALIGANGRPFTHEEVQVIYDHEREAAAIGRTLIAECGGMMALTETIATLSADNISVAQPAFGLLPGHSQYRCRIKATT